MKSIILTLSLFLSATFANAAMWCTDDGTQVLECQQDRSGVITINGIPTRSEAKKNARGYFETTVIPAEITGTLTFDRTDFKKTDNKITLTEVAREKTPEEIKAEEPTVATKEDIIEIYSVLVEKLALKPVDVPTDKADSVSAKTAEGKP